MPQRGVLATFTSASGGDVARLLASSPLAFAACNDPVALAPRGDVPADRLQALETELHRALTDHELLVSSDLRQASDYSTKVLINTPGVATGSLLNKLEKNWSCRAPR